MSELLLRALDGPGERLEVRGAASRRETRDVTEERRVRPSAALVRSDAGEIEDGSRVVRVELELCPVEPRRGSDRLTGLLEPRVHGAILAELLPACA